MKFDSDIIVLDTETTGLSKPIPTPVQRQPYMTEIYAARLTPEFKFVTEINTLVKPPIPISKEITKITGIDDELVARSPTFFSIYDELYDFFEGVHYVVGHNVEFDLSILKYELFRHDLEYKFPWPKHHVCTVESSFHYQNKRLKLQLLHEHLFNESFKGAHRAKNDVMPTIRCFIEMCKRGDIKV